MLSLGFVVNCRLKILNDISMESMECFNKDAQKNKEERKWRFLYIADRDNLIATNAILLNIKYDFYGFNGDLIEAIN